MKGNNELRLNEATMIEALQEWIDKRMTVYAPKVTSVKAEGSGYEREFVVRTEERHAQSETENA